MKSFIKNYLKLTKFGITLLVLLTATAGFFLAGLNEFSYNLFFLLMAGLYFVSSGSFILNQAYEIGLDSKMDRTKNRPLPRGWISPLQARFLGFSFILIGIFFLFFINLLIVLISVLTCLLYNFFYTIKWKKHYPFGAVFLGAIPGAMPVVIGYAAQTHSIFSIRCFYLFLIMFLWQMPHFWSLSFRYKDDYAQGRIPVLPLYLGVEKAFLHIGLYTLAYLGVALFAPLFLNSGILYFIIAVPVCLKIILEYYHFYSQKKWLPFFSWLNISLLIFLTTPIFDKWMSNLLLSDI